MGYPLESLDFRPTFYNPFEIKHRRRTSRAQLKILEKSFSENCKPNATVRRILAQQLDMTPRGVQIWFQNRRAKAKLLRRKLQQQDPKVSAQTVAATAAATCMPEKKEWKEWSWSPDSVPFLEWASSPSSSVDLLQSTYSPQQMTPKLSPTTNGYYEPACLNFSISSSPPPHLL
ncbi:Homeodomain-like protein [Sporodiniella umbellata]|nr:Homeodomain-like protein [Sporodiniella umbellata]